MRGSKPAFTLAEVLITLGIIGVVAAMTMPSLINNTQNKELHSQFKKAYSELNQVSEKFKYDNEISVPDYVRTYGMTPAINVLKTYYKGAMAVNGGIANDDSQLGNYQMYTLGGSKIKSGICDVTGFFAESGGRVFRFNENVPDGNDNGPSVCVDINGSKRPNKYGRDIFIFTFTVDGFVIPMGQEHKNNPKCTSPFDDGSSNNCFVYGPTYCQVSTSLAQQADCAIYALSDEHPTIKGKNYWQDFLGKS